ncbi:class II aldolase/adducin family protein [Nocardioides sp.]|uniref:class II aldolase/adducin family protein n=1 Tax=Nocardioides sp. TaxID=35761 RepID=UPI002608BC18|nr:class II aldolase/adducin family protein [Nocardioides sp.]
MSPTPAALLAAAARRTAEEGLVVGTGGNLSVRDGDRLLVTASGVDLARCTAADVVAVGLDGTPLEPASPAPTSELPLHLGVHTDARSGAGAVVHVHAPWSTAAACVLDELPVVHYQQLLLGGSVRVAPYATFGTPELAAGVRAALAGRSAALMANHGAVVVGACLDQALERALLLEWLCALHHRASALGEVRTLSEAQQHEVVLAALASGYGSTSSSTSGSGTVTPTDDGGRA